MSIRSAGCCVAGLVVVVAAGTVVVVVTLGTVVVGAPAAGARADTRDVADVAEAGAAGFGGVVVVVVAGGDDWPEGPPEVEVVPAGRTRRDATAACPPP